MFRIILGLVFICSFEAQASCRYGYTDPIYVCNYKGQPDVRELKDYKGWSVITFRNITKVLTLKNSQKIITAGVTEQFNFDSDKKIPLNNIQIVRVCNDVRFKNFPDKHVIISPLGNEYCVNYPNPTIIYPHDW